MKGFPITNAVVRSLAIYHTFRNYRTMVNFKINCTLCTGEVRNLEETPYQKPYPGRGECLLIFLVYHKFLNFIQIVGMRAQTNSLRYKNAANNGRSSVKYRITYISKNWRSYKGKSAKIPKQNTPPRDILVYRNPNRKYIIT